jgi:hypothetical protein
MHVIGLKACAIKCGSHFHLAVHPLLAQDGAARPRAADDWSPAALVRAAIR